jgi:hypothetical protein
MSHVHFKSVPPYSRATRYDDPTANSALTGFRQRKRLKKLGNAAKDGIKKEPSDSLGLFVSATNENVGEEPAQEGDYQTNGFDQPVLEGPAEGL